MRRPLNAFLRKLLLYILLVLIGYEVAWRVGLYPVMTVSELFDHKIRQARESPTDPNVMSIGSSQTLFGLNSATIADSLDPMYHNGGSWGLQLTDTWVTLPVLLEEYPPGEIILCASIWDFIAASNASYSEYARTPPIIRHYLPEYFYLRNYRPLSFLYQRRSAHQPLYDRWGGATMGGLKDRFIPDRENMTFPTASTAGNYRSLDSIGDYLQRRKVRFIFVQMPIESRYFGIDSLRGKVSAYFSQCQRLVEGRGGIYLNYSEVPVPDSLFMDMEHIDSMGAIVLTRKLVSDLKRINR